LLDHHRSSIDFSIKIWEAQFVVIERSGEPSSFVQTSGLCVSGSGAVIYRERENHQSTLLSQMLCTTIFIIVSKNCQAAFFSSTLVLLN